MGTINNTDWAMEQSYLSCSEKFVLVTICLNSGMTGHYLDGTKKLAEDVCLQEIQVREILSTLIEKELLFPHSIDGDPFLAPLPNHQDPECRGGYDQ